jgi:hypothetical protein
MLLVCGVLFILVVALFFPRLVVALLLGHIFFHYWIIFGILAFFGFIIDIGANVGE